MTGIGLTDKIIPKGGNFTGMVDADQVIGTSGGAYSSYLPSSAISGNSISEPYLKISNAPTDGYYLQYKDDTDRLTWASVVGGSDVAWSGAYQFYAVSSLNKTQYTQYTGFSSNKSLYPASSQVNRNLINSISSNLDSRIDSIFNYSSNKSLYYPSSLGKSLYNFSANKTLYAESSQVASRFAPSALTDTRLDSIFAFSSNTKSKYKPSSGIWHFVSSQNYSGIRCNNVKICNLNDATVNYLNEYFGYADSAVLLSGANITIGGPTGSISISKGFIAIRTIDSAFNSLWQADIQASSNITLSNGHHHIYIDYNNGSPKYAHRTTGNFNGNTQFPIGQVVNDWSIGTPPETHIVEGGYRFNSLGTKTHQRFGEVYGIERATGLVVASSQSTGHPLAISITAGTLYKGLNEFETTERDTGDYHLITAVNTTDDWFVATGCSHLPDRGNHIKVDSSTGNNGIYIISSSSYASGATGGYTKFYVYQEIPNATPDGQLHHDLFDYYYQNGSGGWKVISGQTSLNVTNYDDNTGTLATLTANRYGVHWVYTDIEGHPVILLGQGDYTLAQAQISSLPSSIPTIIDKIGTFVCRIIVQKSATNLTSAEFATPWTESLTKSTVTSHNDLTGLNGDSTYYHLSQSDYTSLTTTILDNGDASALHHHGSLYPASSQVNRNLINSISSNIDTRVDSLFNWSSNKSWYANSANVRFRFQASSLARQSYLHSSNQAIHSFNIASYITSTNAISRFADSANINAKIDAIGGMSPTDYITSTNSIARFADSANINAKILPSNYTNGWAYVSSESIIAHGYGGRPTMVGLTPSGNDTFGYSLTYDETNIIVFLSVAGKHWVNWFAGGFLPSSALKTWFDTIYAPAVFKSGWSLVSSQSVINHQLGAIPDSISILPSGEDAIGISFKNIDVNSMRVFITDDAFHCVNWNAGGTSPLVCGFNNENELTTLLNDNYAGSSQINRLLLNTISGGLSTRINLLGGFDPVNYIISTTAIARFADSSNINSKFAFSTQTNRGLIDSISSNVRTDITKLYGYSSNAKYLYANSSNINRNLLNIISSNLDTRIDNLFNWSSNKSIYYPSSVGHFYTNSGAKLHSAYLSSNRVLDLFNHTLYGTSSSLISRFAASSIVNTSLITAISSNLDLRVESLFNWSANKSLYYPSSVGHYFTNSGSKLHSTYLSANKVLDRFDHTLYGTSSSLISRFAASTTVNNALIMSISSNQDTRIDSIFNYSANAKTLYADSGNVRFRFYPSSLGKSLMNFSSNKSLYANSSNVRFRFPASSVAISRYYPSTTGKATSGSVAKLWLWSSNKSWYTNSSNVRFRFPASSTAISKYYPSTVGHSDYLHSSNNNIHIKKAISIQSGQVATWGDFGGNIPGWYNYLPPMTYSVANIRLSAQQCLDIVRFTTPANKNVHIFQAHAADSGGRSIHGLFLQVLSGAGAQKIRFRTSSSTLRQGYPISSTTGGITTIRFGYSSNVALTGIKFGSAGCQISII